MLTVGIRELRNGLSRYLKRVRDGETVEITERGTPVARIVPAGIPDPLEKMAAEGRVTLPTEPLRLPKRPLKIKPGPSLSDYISEDRI